MKYLPVMAFTALWSMLTLLPWKVMSLLVRFHTSPHLLPGTAMRYGVLACRLAAWSK